MRPPALLAAALATLTIAGAALPDQASASGGDRFPMVAEATGAEVTVSSAPRRNARRLATMGRLRFDYRRTAFLVIGSRSNRAGDWFRIRVPGRPNGRTGWAEASALRLDRYVGGLRIVVDRSRRRLTLRRGSRKVLRAPVAVGARSAPTPLGKFYVTAIFRPVDPFLGPWALETSAYSAITDWPRGGIVGLHGTNVPSSVGRRASHGCLRVRNRVIRKLKRKVRPGTPLSIRH